MVPAAAAVVPAVPAAAVLDKSPLSSWAAVLVVISVGDLLATVGVIVPGAAVETVPGAAVAAAVTRAKPPEPPPLSS